MEQKIKDLKQNNLTISKNILFFKLKNNLTRIYNIENRHNFVTSDKFALSIQNNDLDNNANKKIIFINSTGFTLWKDMYSNPDFFLKNQKILKKIKISEAIKLLIESECFVNINKSMDLFSRFKGNINKQLGIESLYRREDLSKWWVCQKFNKENLKKMKNNSYKFVQENYVKKFTYKYLNNKIVLEIGCGHGFYSNIFSKKAKFVDGFDYNPDYIDYAKKNYKSKNLNFTVNDITKIEDKVFKKYDYIFMIDVYLFFFDKSFQNKLFNNKNIILKNIRKLLKNNGKLVIIDPHNFWLTPRFGEIEKPYGILSEYNKPSFSSLPNLSSRLEPLFKNYFNLISLEELIPTTVGAKYMDKREYNFIKEFPQWYSFILQKNLNG